MIKKLSILLLFVTTIGLAQTYEEVLYNSDFSQGLDGWVTNDAGISTFSTDSQSVSVSINTKGTEEWQSQLVQKERQIKKGVAYKLIVVIQTDVNTQLSFGIDAGKPNFTKYAYQSETISANTKTKLELEFNSTVSNSNARVLLQFGLGALGTLNITSVSLLEEVPGNTGDCQNLEELLYNSEFGQGFDRWIANDAGISTFSTDSQSVTVQLNEEGIAAWQSQLYQVGIQTDKDVSYKLVIDVEADVNTKLNFGFKFLLSSSSKRSILFDSIESIFKLIWDMFC